ncbi:mechanosensitive channel MscK [Isoalcanivorax indicus]|uniref:mechanosensitive channel MscK n=1 Tax=Isoalcanivorax indicus TaxID=2202653 RepID=UPI0013C43852|nr:mechanosensitive channel MscK [Isoalcanivorax indicus]
MIRVSPTSFPYSLACWLPMLLLCLMSTTASGLGSEDDLPDRDAVQAQIDTLEERELPAARKRLIQEDLDLTLQHLQERADYQARLTQTRERAEVLPREILSTRQALASFTATDTDALTASLQDADIGDVAEALFSRLTTLERLQGALGQANTDLASSQLLPERAQADIASTLARMEIARADLIRLNINDDALENQAAIQRLRAEIAAQDARLALRRTELQSNPDRQSLANRQRELLQRRIADQERAMDAVQAVLDQKRRERTQAIIREAQAPLANLPPSPLLQAELRRNTRLAERIMEVTEQVNTLIRENVSLGSQLERVRQLERTLVEQVAALQGSLLLSRMLYQQQQQLPKLDPRSARQIDVADLRLEQYQLGEQREQLMQPSQQAALMLRRSGETGNEAVAQALEQILTTRLELIEQLEPELNRLLNLAISHQATHRQLQSANRTARDTISEQLFWMPSTRPLNTETLRALPAALVAQIGSLLSAEPWVQAAERLRARWPAPALALIMALGLLWRRPAFTRALQTLNEQVGYLKHDSQQHTPRALGLILLKIAPLPLVLAVTGLTLRTDDMLGATVIGAILLKIAMILLVFGLLQRLLGKSGVAARHFRWPDDNVRVLRRTMAMTALIFIPLGMVIAVGEQAPELLAEDRLGLLIMLCSGPALAWLLARAALHYPTRRQLKGGLVRGTTAASMAAIPLTLTVLSAIGYHYTAIRLGGRLVDTFYILLLWILVAATARRGLAVAARRLAYRRAVARREELRQQQQTARTDSDAGEAVEEPPLDMEQVSAQSWRLTNLFLLITFGIAIYLVWADLLGAMAYLDNIVLWQQVIGEGEQAMFVTTSLRDVIFAFAFLMVAMMMARNLPGLLEVLVLSRLELKPGSAYAITSMMAYTLTIVGLVVALGNLGVSWSKLQWLVAALGVGLGFGLQAIFSNFVSGIILLFERPIRIGDVITIGDLSGTVMRIRIRATTIRDFDRKEIIVPNQKFVQEQLINWSLSDNVTRLVLKIGFAYGSDLKRAHEVLLQAAGENERVLRDPAPTAFFLGFGASTLDHELRVHVAELADRLPVQDELNRRIDQLCKENGIEIAFSQLDVHIRTPKGKELCVQKDAGREPPDDNETR